MNIAWGTDETAGLSERMAHRWALFMKENNDPKLLREQKIPPIEAVCAGLGEHTNERPSWVHKDSELQAFLDNWHDWTDDELATLLDRLKSDVPREILYKVFRVGVDVRKVLDKKAFGTAIARKMANRDDRVFEIEEELPIQAVVFHESAEFDDGAFSIIDIKNTDDRRFANRRYLEYSEGVDNSKPQNQTLIRILVIHEVELQKTTRQLNSDDDAERKSAMSALLKLHSEFSKAAESLALLEKQFKTEPKQENLDDIIKRTQDIRLDWYDMQIENQMGLHNLYALYEKMHKTHISDDEETEPVQVPVVERQNTGRTKSMVIADIALSAIRASEDKTEGMVIESDG